MSCYVVLVYKVVEVCGVMHSLLRAGLAGGIGIESTPTCPGESF